MLPFIYLASSSPRRQELLTLLDVPFQVITPNIAEIKSADESAHAYVIRLAKEKAYAGLQLASQDHPVLAADTIILCDEQVLEKPHDVIHAQAMLQQLSGRSHIVITAIALVDKHGYLAYQHVVTEVQFCRLTDREIINYLALGESMDKAGAYAIQGYGGSLIQKIVGSYHNVVGLPLAETRQMLANYFAINE